MNKINSFSEKQEVLNIVSLEQVHSHYWLYMDYPKNWGKDLAKALFGGPPDEKISYFSCEKPKMSKIFIKILLKTQYSL